MPTNRSTAQMAYDPALKEVVLFGGYVSSAVGRIGQLGDTWIYRAGTWTNLTPRLNLSPPARWGGSFAYDPQAHALLLFGGRDNYAMFRDSWYFNATGWHRHWTTVAPSARMLATMTFDPLDGGMLLFGGLHIRGPNGTGAWNAYNDTWAFSGGRWRYLGLAPISPRFSMRGFWDPAAQAVLLQGGVAGGRLQGKADLWSFSGGHWTSIATLVSPPATSAWGCLAFDVKSGTAVLFGGQAQYSIDRNYTWLYRSGAWVNLTRHLAPTPPARDSCMMVYDRTDGYLFLYGGSATASNNPQLYAGCQDSWEFA
ncbi:MAG TPA: hypothetical protein VFF67_10075 [Thermoplasmata archaeon]|nr:hypothetical protein [Thermoplasmata archaeon]